MLMEQYPALNKVYSVDCMELFPKIPDESIDLLLTDPPYEIDYISQWPRSRHRPITGDRGFDYFRFASECFRVLKKNTHAYFFTRFDKYPRHYTALTQAGFCVKNCLVIEKGQCGGLGDLRGSFSNNSEWVIFCHKGRREFNQTRLLPYVRGVTGKETYKTRFSACWFGESYPKANYNITLLKKLNITHPTVKNRECLQWLILLSSNPGELVFDPFMGSGSTALASMEAGRYFSGCEIDAEYYQMCLAQISERLERAVLNPLPRVESFDADTVSFPH